MGDTLANFKTRTRLYLRETTASTSYWTDTFLTQMFNMCYHRRCSQLIMAYEGYFTAVANRDIDINKARYALPSGTLRILKVERVLSNSTTVPLIRDERHERANPGEAVTSGDGDSYLPTFRPMANGLILEPTPRESITLGMRIEISILPDKLVGDSDRIHASFPEIFEELLVLDTAILALSAEGAMETGQMRALLPAKVELEEDFRRFIEARVVLITETAPFVPSYFDA